MTLDEAIKHAEEVVKKDNNKLKIYELINEDRPFFIEEETEYRLREDEHRQLAEWLKDYKRLLEQEPCGDCISRSSIKKKLQEHHDFYVKAYDGFSNLPQNDKSRVDEITNCISMVVNEPTVTSKPKMGRWNFEGNNCFSCTSCGTVYTLEQFTYMVNHRYDTFPKFCPLCGSYNKGKELRMQEVGK